MSCERGPDDPAGLAAVPLCEHVDLQHDRVGPGPGQLLHPQVGAAAQATPRQDRDLGRETGNKNK